MTLVGSYSIENDRQFAAEIEKSVKLVGDLRVAFGLIGRDWFKSNRAQFSLKGSGQYTPLRERYAQEKRRAVGNKPILVRSGRLRDSVTNFGSADSVINITQTAMILGTRVPHGIYHQSDKPRRVIPLRKFLFIGPEAPRTAPSQITGRLERWMGILATETARKLK